MPGMDGTGPMGTGGGIGRHMGTCRNSIIPHGLRLRDGSCRYPVNERDALILEKRILESRRKLIDRKLDSESD